MKRKIFCFSMVFFLALAAYAEGKAKYVFYFIGDGMGVNQVNLTETYLAAIQGRIGVEPLLFSGFPFTGLVTTYSATNGVTDSAAGGTALATGEKTRNGAVGMKADAATAVPSIAQRAKAAGAAVGIATSVSIDHATPASFYAHVPNRSMYYEIGKDLVRAGFDFYAGSDFLKPQAGKDTKEPNLYEQCRRAGYVIARGYADFCQQETSARQGIILFQEEKAADRSSLPYAINRQTGDLTLTEITQAATDFLSRRNKDGFFLMVEGGKIDWACHANDAATVIKEVMDLDQAVRVAYDFYLQHPDETLIVITADHETGGLALGCGPYELHTDLLQYQKMSADRYTQHITHLRKEAGENFTWDLVRKDLQANWGFWDKVALSEQEEALLKQAFDALKEGMEKGDSNLYSREDALSTAARRLLNRKALVGWQSGGHSNGYVPVFAIGAGAEHFVGKLENTDIPKRIVQAAGWK
ncbi:MAG: alkaline phosphatase [Bacteroidaceae bacterium]|nr:alkaline phosphatase [Bacteroidaceae bacterium]